MAVISNTLFFIFYQKIRYCTIFSFKTHPSLVLSILTAFLTFLLGIGTALLYIVMVFCIFGALASFIQGEVGIGISGLIIGFLFSPYGLPMIGAIVIAFIELINEKIKAV